MPYFSHTRRRCHGLLLVGSILSVTQTSPAIRAADAQETSTRTVRGLHPTTRQILQSLMAQQGQYTNRDVTVQIREAMRFSRQAITEKINDARALGQIREALRVVRASQKDEKNSAELGRLAAAEASLEVLKSHVQSGLSVDPTEKNSDSVSADASSDLTLQATAALSDSNFESPGLVVSPFASAQNSNGTRGNPQSLEELRRKMEQKDSAIDIAQKKCRTDDCTRAENRKLHTLLSQKDRIRVDILEKNLHDCKNEKCRKDVLEKIEKLEDLAAQNRLIAKGPPKFKLRVLGGLESLHDGYGFSRVAWNPETRRNETLTETYLQDGTAYTAWRKGVAHTVFGNFLCGGRGVTFNLAPNQIQSGINGGDCQRTFYQSIQRPDRARPWSEGTRVTWSAHNPSGKQGEKLALINFSELRSLKRSDGSLGRSTANSNGYVDFHMDGKTRVVPDIDPKTPGLQPALSDFVDGYYNGFVNISFVTGRDSLAQDAGPIIWPAAGYRYKKGKFWYKSSIGVRHPRGFVHEGYLYVFYLAHEQILKSGKIPGTSGARIYIARSELKSGLGPGTWKCGADFKASCLPQKWKGWDKGLNHFVDMLSEEGPNVKPIIDGDGYYGIMSFAVAKVDGQKNLFVGVSSYRDNGWGKSKISLSRDLIHWSKPQEIPQSVYGPDVDWNGGPIIFPRLASLSDGDPERVKLDGFWVVGNSSRDARKRQAPGWQWHISRIKVAIDLE